MCCPLTFSFILLHRPSGAGNIHPPRSAASDSIFDCCGPTLDVPEPESTSVWPSHPGPLTYTQAPTTQTSARTKKVQHEILVLGLSSGRASSGLSDRSAPGPAASPLRRATGSGFEGDGPRPYSGGREDPTPWNENGRPGSQGSSSVAPASGPSSGERKRGSGGNKDNLNSLLERLAADNARGKLAFRGQAAAR